MRLEDQVCSLEPSKRLNELGVKQESYFCWYGNILASKDRVKLDLKERGLNCYGSCEIYSAFTVAELGEKLKSVKSFITEFFSDQIILYEDQADDTKCNEEFGCADTEADARARMLIYLIENGYINARD